MVIQIPSWAPVILLLFGAGMALFGKGVTRALGVGGIAVALVLLTVGLWVPLVVGA